MEHEKFLSFWIQATGDALARSSRLDLDPPASLFRPPPSSAPSSRSPNKQTAIDRSTTATTTIPSPQKKTPNSELTRPARPPSRPRRRPSASPTSSASRTGSSPSRCPRRSSRSRSWRSRRGRCRCTRSPGRTLEEVLVSVFCRYIERKSVRKRKEIRFLKKSEEKRFFEGERFSASPFSLSLSSFSSIQSQ